MAKYRKKPVVIEARQFVSNNEPDDGNLNELVEWIETSGGSAWHTGTDLYIATLEAVHRASVGDWIIKGVNGKFYLCEPDSFEMIYEPVED